LEDFLPNKQGKLKNISSLGVFLFCLLKLAQVDLISTKEQTFFEQLIVEFFAPTQMALTTLKTKGKEFFADYLANVSAQQQNRTLQTEVATLKNKLLSFREIEEENLRLKQLFNFQEKFSGKKLLAQIVSRDVNNAFQMIRLNKGSSDGVIPQSPVVTADGLIGHIYRVTPHYSDVLTILDPKNKVDILISRTRAHGILEGKGDSYPRILYMSSKDPVEIGDLVITSGLGAIYPKGIFVGHIKRIQRSSIGLTERIQLSPFVNFDKLEEVLVLLFPEKTELKAQWNLLDKEQ